MLRPLITLSVGVAAGTVATLISAPIPWLLGSLLATAVITGTGVRLYQYPATLEKWMRVLIGVALGPAVANTLIGFSGEVVLAIVGSLISVVVLIILGTVFFKRALGLSRGEAFLCALPGGLSFMMALADEMRTATTASRPRIALVHTVRVVSLVLFVSLIAVLLGTDLQKASFIEWFRIDLTADVQWVFLVAVVVASGLLADKLSIAGGHVTIPLLLASGAYATGLVSIPMPPLVITCAMLVFGGILGCELGNGPRSEYPRLGSGSLVFTAVAFIVGALLSVLLGNFSGFGFLTLFLALAPGGIAEVSLIALALGLDVGVIALVHTCRFLFIMLAGPLGLRLIATPNSPR